MAELEAVLQAFGLTPNDIKVYLALLRTGATTSGLIVKRTGLHIPRVYEALARLESKGLVSHVIRNSRKHFEAAEPERLVEIAKNMESKLNSIMPQLSALKKSQEAKEETATIYQGKRGIRGVLSSMLEELQKNKGAEYVDFGVSGLFKQVMGPYWDAWQREKKRKRIKSRCIFEESVRGSALQRDYYGEARFVPNKYHCPSDTIIYGDKIVVLIWSADPPTAILIKDKTSAQGYKNIFEWMWGKAEK